MTGGGVMAARGRSVVLRLLTGVGLAMAVLAVVRPGNTALLLVLSAAAGGLVPLGLARSMAPGDRLAWVLIGLGQLLNSAGNVAILMDRTEWFAMAGLTSSIVFTVATICTVAGLLSFTFHAARPSGRWWLLSDALVVTGAAFVVAWSIDLQLLDGGSPATSTTHFLGMAALAAETVALVVGVKVWWSRPPGERVAPRLAVLAVLVAWLADATMIVGLAGQFWLPESLLMQCWVVSSCLVVVGAVQAVGGTGRVVAAIDVDRAVVPLSAALLVCVPVVVLLSPSGADPVMLRVGAAVIVGVVLRLLVVASGARALTARLRSSEAHFRSMVETNPDLLIRMNADGRITFISPSAVAVFRVQPEWVVGRWAQDLVVPADANVVRMVLDVLAGDPSATQRADLRVPRQGGAPVHLEAVATRVGEELVVAVRDVSERVQLQTELVQAAYRDALTGLPNRSAFDLAMQSRASGSAIVAIVFCDLDGFKAVNDTRGHVAGDALLVEAGRRVADVARPGDLATRFGGDEFAILLGHGSDLEVAEQLAADLVEALARPLALPGGQLVTLGASAGVAAAPAGDPTGLLRDADLAMYQAKADGRGRVRVFEAGMLQAARRRVDLEQRLYQAVVHERLDVWYQPIVDLPTGAVVGAEALLRWIEHGRPVLAANELIELAEHTGRIERIGAWVLDQALARSARWARADLAISVSVNVSVVQLGDERLVGRVAGLLRHHGVPADRLTLEITESVLLDHTTQSITTLEQLCALGVHLAVDDFGTGYSALDYLRRLPVDQLKVDRAFVQGLGEQADAAAMLRSIAGLGADLGLTVTVEGVETPQQVHLLRQMKVQRAQGFAFAGPLQGPQLLDCLRRGPFLLPDDPRKQPVVTLPDSISWTASSQGKTTELLD